MVSANRVAAINPPIDDTDPTRKFSIDPGSHTDWQNPAEFSPKGKPIRNFSIGPTSSIRTSIADAIFADAISETSSSLVLSQAKHLALQPCRARTHSNEVSRGGQAVLAFLPRSFDLKCCEGQTVAQGPNLVATICVIGVNL